MTKCKCGFPFVTDRPLEQEVEVICPNQECGRKVTLKPDSKKPANAGGEGNS